MKLNNIILQEVVPRARSSKKIRSTPISLEEAQEYIDTKCSDALNAFHKGKMIYRGVHNENEHIFVQPSKYKRVSRHTYNQYTELMSEVLPSWKNYPKRSRSIVCTTSANKAKDYGRTYVVFPKNGSSIGVCSEEDIWDSFSFLLHKELDVPSGGNMAYFDDILRAFSNTVSDRIKISFPAADPRKKWNEIDDFIKNHGFLKSDEEFQRDVKYLKRHEEYGKWAINLMLHTREHDGVVNFFDYAMSPNKNGFELTTTKGITSIPKNREVWTDGDCVLLDGDSELLDSMFK